MSGLGEWWGEMWGKAQHHPAILPTTVRIKPDIVHFIAHGEPDRLALIRPAGDIQKDKDDDKPLKEAAWCDAQEILDLFANHTPRLVFLQACDSAREVKEKRFASLARKLVQEDSERYRNAVQHRSGGRGAVCAHLLRRDSSG
jgi:CHAT domain